MLKTAFALLLLTVSFIDSAAAAPACAKCNVLLVSLDATQAAHIHHLGYPLETTPELDRLAQNGVSFSRAISPSSWTIPTYLSVFSSTYPSVHGLVNRYEKFTPTEKVIANFTRYAPNLLTMADVFKSAGYKTGGFTGDSGVSAVLGYNKGFDFFTDETPFGGIDKSGEHAVDWLSKLAPGDRFFVFLHGYDSHGQYGLPQDYRGKFTPAGFKGTKEAQAALRERALKGETLNMTDAEIKGWRGWYDSKIYDADQRLAQFLKIAGEKGWLKNTIIVVISDHGTEFFEHGKVDHGHTLYDELVRVPLIFDVPGLKGRRVVSEQVSTLDILPTLLELTGVAGADALQNQIVGQSLAPALAGKPVAVRDVYSETDYRNYTHKRSVRTKDGWKLIITLENGQEELYDLRHDPAEKTNLATRNPEISKRLRKLLSEHLEKNLHSSLGAKLSSECLPVYPGQCQ